MPDPKAPVPFFARQAPSPVVVRSGVRAGEALGKVSEFRSKD